MSSYFATVGYTPDKVGGALRRRGGVSRLVAFHGPTSNIGTQRALEQLERSCATLGIAMEPVRLNDPFNLGECLATFRSAVQQRRPAAFNVSGGTNIMQIAAVMVCALGGVTMESYNVEIRRLQQLPPIRLQVSLARRSTSRRVAAFLARHPGIRPGEAAKALALSPSRLSYHLAKLREAGLLAPRAHGERGLALIEGAPALLSL
jgi:DNA-binding transcriptional ArsR family regulator